MFHVDWLTIGMYLGSYQAARVVANIASIWSPLFAHTVGTMIGLAGNAVVLLSSNDAMKPILIGTAVIGFSESIACMQTYLKHLYISDLTTLEHKIKVQYASVTVGVTFAFALGGVIYEHYDIDGVAILGMGLSTLELASLLTYVLLNRMNATISNEKNLQKNDRTLTAEELGTMSLDALSKAADALKPENKTIHTHGSVSSSSHDDDSIEDAQKPPESGSAQNKTSIDKDANVSSSPKNAIREVIDLFSASNFGANYMSYLLCFTFGMEAITIGYNLTITPLYILEQFEKSPGLIGIILAAGSAAGNIVGIFITLTPAGKSFMQRFLPCPNDLFFTMAGISVSVFLAAIPIFYVHMTGLLLLMAFNDAASIILAGMQGEITSTKAYSKIGPLGQVIRRCLNCVTAITGPLLFSVLPSLPYIVAGLVTAFWTGVLWVVIRGKMKTNNTIIEDALREVGQEEEDRAVSCERLYDESFPRQEVLARQLKRGMSRHLHCSFPPGEVQFPVRLSDGDEEEGGVLPSFGVEKKNLFSLDDSHHKEQEQQEKEP